MKAAMQVIMIMTYALFFLTCLGSKSEDRKFWLTAAIASVILFIAVTLLL